MDFAQFTMKFGASISRSSNRKMVGKFHVICQNMGFLTTKGGYMDVLTGTIDANGADFTSFII